MMYRIILILFENLGKKKIKSTFNWKLTSDWYKSMFHDMACLNRECVKI